MNTIPFLHNLDHLSEIAGLLLIYKTIIVSSLPMRLPLHLLTPNTHSNYLSYDSLNPDHKAFSTSLSTTYEPATYKEAIKE